MISELDAQKFLEDLSGRFSKPYTNAVRDMVLAMSINDKQAVIDARKILEEMVTETMGIGEVLGASLTLRRAASVSTG